MSEIKRNEQETAITYRSHREAIKYLNIPDGEKYKMLDAILGYQLDNEPVDDIQFEDESTKYIFKSFMESYSALIRRKRASQENGKKGGHPKKMATTTQKDEEVSTYTSKEEKVPQNEEKGHSEPIINNVPAPAHNEVESGEELSFDAKKMFWSDIKPLINDSNGVLLPNIDAQNNLWSERYGLMCKYNISEEYIDTLFERVLDKMESKQSEVKAALKEK